MANDRKEEALASTAATSTSSLPPSSTRIAMEPPVVLSQSSRIALEKARRKLWEKNAGNGVQMSGHQNGSVKEEEGDDEKDSDVAARAWLDRDVYAPSSSIDRRPLFAKMEKLLAERGGDFSKIHSSHFKKASTNRVKEVGAGARSKRENELDLGVEMLDEEEEVNGDGVEAGEKGSEGVDDKGKDSIEGKEGRDAMTIEEMRTFRSEMLDNLNTARGSLYYSHSLVSLLLNSSKAESGSSNINSNSSSVGGRAGTPSSSTGGGVARAGTATSIAGGGGAGGAANQRNMPVSQLQQMSNAANLEADLGIEANVFGTSKLQPQSMAEAGKMGKGQGFDAENDDRAGDDEEEDDDDEEHENLQKELQRDQRRDASTDDKDVEDRARDLIECYQAKHDGLASAADILAKGAKALRASASSGDETKRWTALNEARLGGWGLVPGRPIRVKDGKRELLPEDAAAAAKKRDEPARDAWIGYAAPEAAAAYQRRALAYYGYSPGDGVVFAARSNRALQVSFIVKEGQDAKSCIWTSRTSDSATTDGEEEEKEKTIEEELREAQRELADVELFDAILAECRALSSASLARVTIEDAYNVSLEVNSLTDMRFSMVEKGGDKDKDKGAAPCTTKQTEVEEGQFYSPVANTILASLRLGLGKKYRQRAGISSRKSSEAIRSQKRKLEAGDGVFRRTAPLLTPILGLIHYISFLNRLESTLQEITEAHDATYQLHTRASSAEAMKILLSAFEEDNEEEVEGDNEKARGTAAQDLFAKSIVARASVFTKSSPKELNGGTTATNLAPVALLTITYPSRLSISLPARGVHLPSIDLRSLRDILLDQLSKP